MNRSVIRGVRLAAVGDVMLGDSAICTGYGFASRYGDMAGCKALAQVGHLFRSADIVFGNLECSLSTRGHNRRRWTSTQLRGSPEFAAALRDAGFNIMNVANNHASQHGDEAFADTVELMRSVGVACCGLRGTGAWCSEPVVLTSHGIRLGFLGYCLRPRQYSAAVPPYAEGTRDDIVADVARLRHEVDHVITSLHWGEEYVATPSEGEIGFAHEVMDAGTSVLLGHHPHVARPVERHGNGIIAYSLGNFVSDMIWYNPLRYPIVLTMALKERPEDVAVSCLRVDDSFLPAPFDPPRTEPVVKEVVGLPEDVYQSEIVRTIREQRTASYLHAAKNAHRFRSPTLAQLVGTTVRNKVAAVAGRLSRRRDAA